MSDTTLVSKPILQEIHPNTATKPPHIKALNLPRPTLVYMKKEESENCKTWNEMNPPWTGLDVVQTKTIITDNDEKHYDVFINMDSNDLHTFLLRKKMSQSEQDNVKRLYQTSILLYSLVLYNDLSKKMVV